MMPPPGMSKKINALSVIGVLVIGVIVFEKKLAKSLREELVTLKGNKNMLHSYEKLSPQLGRKFFPTGAQNLETTAKEWRDGGKRMERRRLSAFETASPF